MFKKFLLLTSSSAVGLFVSLLLHGAVHGLFILLFGEDFWQRVGIEDEPLLFMLAVFVCPLAYLVGTVGKHCSNGPGQETGSPDLVELASAARLKTKRAPHCTPDVLS